MSTPDGFPVSLDDGWVTAAVADGLPGLLLRTARVDCVPGPSPEGLRRQLRLLSDRMTGARAIRLRSDPVPQAYRVCFRLIGMDPDVTLTPVEQAAKERLFHGGHRSRGLVEDAQLLALVETGVPVYAFDDAALAGPLGVRAVLAGERLGTGEHAGDLTPGRLVVADPEGVVGVLFGMTAPERRVTAATGVVRLVAVGVEGVPRIHVEEALFVCAEALRAG